MIDFWSIFARTDCFPNCGCERMMDGCWVCQPVSIASSLPYLIVAVLLLVRHKKPGKKLILWSTLLGIVGLSSMFAHSTYIRAAMAMDYTSIIFLQTFFFFTRLIERSPLQHISHYILYPGYYLFLYVLLVPLDVWSQFYVALIFFSVALVDFLYHKGLSILWERNLIISFFLLGISVIFMLIDKYETFCAMKYVPYGHSIWHLGSALSAWYFGWWYFYEHEAKLEKGSEKP